MHPKPIRPKDFEPITCCFTRFYYSDHFLSVPRIAKTLTKGRFHLLLPHLPLLPFLSLILSYPISRARSTHFLLARNLCWLGTALFSAANGGENVAPDFWRVAGCLDGSHAVFPGCTSWRICLRTLFQQRPWPEKAEILASRTDRSCTSYTASHHK